MTDRPRPRPGIKPPAHPHGSLILSTNSSTSAMERKAVAMLTAAGVDLIVERMAIQAGHDIIWDIHPLLTPDAIVAGTNVCIEIDPAWTHEGDPKRADDTKRNDLLTAVGWTVVRLRLGNLKPIGEYDVVVDTDRIAPEGIAGYLRFPLLTHSIARSHAYASRPLGIMRAYPTSLADLPGFGSRASGDEGVPGARALAGCLVTGPTHEALTEDDLQSLHGWLSAR